MGLNNTLTRLLDEPTSRERAVLESDISDILGKNTNDCDQLSFLNGMAGDLDAKVISIHKNTDQRIIIVTQDKAILTLKKNIATLGKKEWIAPLSTVTTILIALITSNFKAALGLGPAEWRAMFIISGFLATGWLAYSIRKSLHAKTFQEVITDTVTEMSSKKCVQSAATAPGILRKNVSASAVINACRVKTKTLKKKPKMKKRKN